MSSSPKLIHFFLTLISAIALWNSLCSVASTEPVPKPWPLQFHSILLRNNSEGQLVVTDIWYDFPNGRNVEILQMQLGVKLYNVEWNNGSSFYFTLDPDPVYCHAVQYPVGIPLPNWVDGAKYLGQRYMDGFLCNVWEKLDFIWYYEDVITQRPVYWAFYNGMVNHVMTFEVGKVLEYPYWQAPYYCFQEANEQKKLIFKLPTTSAASQGSLIREVLPNIPLPIVT